MSNIVDQIISNPEQTLTDLRDGLSRAHRTHQQVIIKVLALALYNYGQDTEEYDPRNVAAVSLCREKFPELPYLPFI